MNIQWMRYRKTFIAVLGLLGVVLTVLPDGITGDEWEQILYFASTAFGVWLVPNAPKVIESSER